jgi:two-component system sensor histidine kinase KdpD
VELLAQQAGDALERADLAERHDAVRAEVEAERLRTALLSSLSHDLRTPLGSIEGAASTLLEDGGTLAPEVRRLLAQTILEESRRMTRLVTNLLDMVRVESGTLAVQKAWQPLEEALGVALLRMDERLSNRVVETQLPADLPFVPIDELLIEQVFVNLLENAIKYTPPDSPIVIAARRADGAVLVEVADRGPGVAESSRELVFHKFHRGGGDGATKPAGAGLGLTICRGIITAHGGRIWVDPREGGGAVFRFTLPLEGPPTTPPPEE